MGWVTINGAHVFIDEKIGAITKGPAHLVGTVVAPNSDGFNGRDGGLYNLQDSISIMSAQQDLKRSLKRDREEAKEIRKEKMAESYRERRDKKVEQELQSSDPEVRRKAELKKILFKATDKVEDYYKLDEKAQKALDSQHSKDLSAMREAQKNYSLSFNRQVKESTVPKSVIRSDPTQYTKHALKSAFLPEIKTLDKYMSSKGISDPDMVHTGYFLENLQKGMPLNKAANEAVRKTVQHNKEFAKYNK